MQVIKKETQIRQVEITIESYTLCDKCNSKIKTSTFDAFECEFIHKTGNSFPEGGSGNKQEMELCQQCAVELVDLLIENGYRINESEWDF